MVDKELPKLWGQFIRFISSEFDRNGVYYADIANEALLFAYLNWLRRSVPPKPRCVLKSNEFECREELAEGLAEIERKIIAGDVLAPHLSRELVRADYKDKMLNDWGVYHLHLGVRPHPKIEGIVERTRPLLYARFDQLNAYLIGIVPRHGLWTSKKIIQIVHNNWPLTIQRYRASGITSDGVGHSDAGHSHIRKYNANALICLEENVVYMGPGGGLVGSGESASTWRLHDYILIQLEEFDKWVAQAKGKTIPSNPRFNLGIAREGNTLGLAVVEMSLNRLIWSREMSLD